MTSPSKTTTPNMESGEASSSVDGTSSDLMTIVQSAAQIPAGSQRDAALLAALRICRRELEAAESEADAAQSRLSQARETFDCAARLLSGGALPSQSGGASGAAWGKKKRGSGGLASEINQILKRSKSSHSTSSLEGEGQLSTLETPTNPIHVPAHHTSIETEDAVIMSEEVVAEHRENFYQKLLGISVAELGDYVPPYIQANLKTEAQLEEGIHIVSHWDTGADGLDAAAFRSKHKSWYVRMRPVLPNTARRSGVHIRMLKGEGEEEEDGTPVLCRYNKDGTESVVFVAISQIYDALFEIHCLERDHLRGKDAIKARVDQLYGNITSEHVKMFLETCPVCIERQRAVV
eukprot:CAMPEP_0183716742 /NCGR_PEP_ID=MMETSP0737-20130205/10524_1 /TAXON_ID=385413 /ORGANISM="Thalassiosira miniscula, Strain CCMP1093" /LENGTH=348 /DNA_ID=CAMNT_0025946041 /DNA_START=1 /DNA_END=1047 /DNA_ORIENTATION=-